ncbi:hypothetical protein ScPMuIL_014498, partial [Solemya velum]
PDGIAAPSVSMLTPTSVEITWIDPIFPNGEIIQFALDRREKGMSDITEIATFLPTETKVYVDDDAVLSPHTEYEYRLRITNHGGEGESIWVTVLTMSSRPAGVNPPSVNILGPTSMEIVWAPPLQPNGALESYTISLPEPRLEFRNTTFINSVVVNDLTPYTQYMVILTACTSAGCTESVPAKVRTDGAIPEGLLPPVPTPISQNMISVLWQPPDRSNGPNLRYELSRKKVRQPLDTQKSDIGIWLSAYAGVGMFFNDRGLPLFTTYVYRVTVYNNFGQLTSGESAEVMTFGGFPRTAADVTATALDHVSILVEWSTPGIVSLQGEVTEYLVTVYGIPENTTEHISPGTNQTVLTGLTPNTAYRVTVTIIINGGASITSEPVTITTKDGAPEGMDRPVIAIINESTLRISWFAPKIPNGEVTGYIIYVNNDVIPTNVTIPSSYVLTGLKPFTVYAIQIEVCTTYDCTQSPAVLATTAEAQPADVAPPQAVALTSTTTQLSWTEPLQPNGVVLRYDLWRRTIKPCSQVPIPTVDPEITKCTYVECSILENICGVTCYSGTKICCSGVVHDMREGYGCCGKDYIPKLRDTDICCGGKNHRVKDNFQCCGNRYVEVLPDSICCSDPNEDRVLMGKGDQCCGSVPYSSTGSQICCAGMLHDGYGTQCCGEEVVADTLICCGGPDDGMSYTRMALYQCCGSDYVDSRSSLCCVSDTGHTKVHSYASAATKTSANQKCCGTKTISNGLSCCNYVGYNVMTHLCADISRQDTGCGSATICPIGGQGDAFCNRCDFDHSQSKCGSVKGVNPPMIPPLTPNPTDSCMVSEDRIHSGMNYLYEDSGLAPDSVYTYAVAAVNKAGSLRSDFESVTTLEDAPGTVLPPQALVDPKQLYAIFLSWEVPQIPNGIIVEYILTRDGLELYRGLKLEYEDATTIQPFQSYSYIITACTKAGCTSSEKETVATAQNKPEEVIPPEVVSTNSTAMTVRWYPPGKPNGIIMQYTLYVIGQGVTTSYNRTAAMSIIITDLVAYTDYDIYLAVCTQAGCSLSMNTSAQTNEATPQGLQVPVVIILSASSVEIYWQAPVNPNGEILSYTATRRQQAVVNNIYTGMDLNCIDTGLVPGVSYDYTVSAENTVGEVTSEARTVKMPIQTPSNIVAPQNVTALSPYKIYISWDPIEDPGGQVDQYRIIINAGQPSDIELGMGLLTSFTLQNLSPYTNYEVRIMACLAGIQNGCGTGPSTTVQTFEAPPQLMSSPVVVAKSWDVVLVSWKPPTHPNGILTQYSIYYRKVSDGVRLLIYRVSDDVYEYTHAGQELQPYTDYEYQVVVTNSEGDAQSPWAAVRTLEAPPNGLMDPILMATGPFSVDVVWLPPANPNGVITLYRVFYKLVSFDSSVPTNLSSLTIVEGLRTSISGLEPYSSYQVKLMAVNGAGNTSSIWIDAQTLEASPSGMSVFDVEKINTGLAVILSWDPPLRSNGLISSYQIYEFSSDIAIYQGLQREFEFQRLTPFTSYTVRLEACTTAGCTRGIWQDFLTAEIAPTSQPRPSVGEVGPDFALITWVKPGNPNGEIVLYEVLRIKRTAVEKRSLTEPVVVYSTTNTANDSFTFKDTGLEPFTEYQYSIRATNSKGQTQSPWQTVSTTQAPPEGISEPVISYITDVTSGLHIAWSQPTSPNGIIQSYQLQRNDSIPLSFTPSDPMEFDDTKLNAFTVYSYTITVCSGGGCTTSEPASLRTKETAPLSIDRPSVDVLGSTSLKIRWMPPQITNGKITAYQLKINDAVAYEGLNLEFTVDDLVPYQPYQFAVTACTEGGCTNSEETTGRPADDIPSGLEKPKLTVLSSSSIEVTWNSPSEPNGVISSYDVKRDGTLIYTESLSTNTVLQTTYTDFNLDPGTAHTYTVVARNRKGSVESLPSSATTYSSSPTGLMAPTLSVLSSTSIQASWRPPLKLNGPLQNYTLYQNGITIYSGATDKLSYTSNSLAVWTDYEFRIQACTNRGCASSQGEKARTLEAQPMNQGAPIVLAMGNEEGKHVGVLVSWLPPVQPNGVITFYEVERRQVFSKDTGPSYGDVMMVYNGSSQQYTDKDMTVEPNSNYEYRVSSVNKAGRGTSTWSSVRTKQAPPDTVPPPTVNSTTSSTITVMITPPSTDYGAVRYYNILFNGSLGSSGPSLQQTVGISVPLMPYTTYALQVEACTAGGCVTSTPVFAKTGSSRPSGLDPLVVIEKNSTSITLGWSFPSEPNGEITKFTLYQRASCPLTMQPFSQYCEVGAAETIYEGLLVKFMVTDLSPYTAFEFQVQAENDVGGVEVPIWVRVETNSSDPVYAEIPTLMKNYTDAIINWPRSFTLNGQLRAYEVYADERLVFRGVSTYQKQPLTSVGQILIFKIICTTVTGQAETPDIVFDAKAVGNIGTTPAPTRAPPLLVATPVYEELWFIVLMVVIGLLLLFLLLVLCIHCCVRGRPFLRERIPVRASEKRARPLVYYVDPNDSGINTVTQSQELPISSHASRQRSRSSKPSSRHDDPSRHSGPSRLDDHSLSPGVGVVNPAFSANILKDTSIDKVSSLYGSDEYLWDKNHDSGLFDEELSSLETPSYSVTREQTVFTDTHL